MRNKKSRVRKKSGFGPNRGIIISAAVLVILAALVTGSCVFAAKTVNTGLIYDGVCFKDENLGGKTKEEATELIKALNEERDETVTVTYLGNDFEIAPKAAGINYDAEKIAENAYNTARGGNIFSRFFKVRELKDKKLEIEPVYMTDKELFTETITVMASDFFTSLEPFSVKINGDTAEVTINRDDKIPDYSALFDEFLKAVEENSSEPIPMPLTDDFMISAQDIYNKIYVEPKDAYAEEANGKLTLHPEVIGIDVSMDAIEKALVGVTGANRSFSVAVTKVYPKVKLENIEGGYFTDVLGSFQTTYKNSTAERAHNVELAAKKINGIILNSGDIFSYNKTVGSRTKAAGFKTATIYSNGGLSEETGGGICQVSSTLYAAALYADMKIVERHNHTYTVSYMKAGMDATVYYGSLDFRFSNNKSGPVKISATTSGRTLTVKILGIKEDNNSAEITTNVLATYPIKEEIRENSDLAPGASKVVQSGQEGVKVSVTRLIKDASGKTVRKDDLGVSVYSPMNKIIESGGEKEPEPEPEPEPQPEPQPVPEPQPIPEPVPGSEEVYIPELPPVPETEPQI